MRGFFRSWIPLIALVPAVTLGLTPATSEACGGTFCDGPPPEPPPDFEPMPVDQEGEDILFLRKGDEIQVHIRIEYDGEAERFAWLVPLQAVPEVSVGSAPLFTALREATTPEWRTELSYECPEDEPQPPPPNGGDGDGDGDVPGDGDGDGDGDAGGPEIVLEETVGAFEVIVLQGGTAAEVIDFLDANNYAQDPEAEPIMQEYLDEGFLFAAVKLTAAASVDEIHPLVFEFTGTEPCVPIRLTRIAAKDDMNIRVYFLGEDRWAPSNYAHVVLNPLQFYWNNPASWRYDRMVRAAVDEAEGGRGFITEYAGTRNVVSLAEVFDDSWNADAYLGSDPVTALDIIVSQGLEDHPLLMGLLLEFIPPPDNVNPFDFWNDILFYQDQIDWNAWDAAAFAAAIQERIIDPGFQAKSVVEGNAYLTKLRTRMSPHEMLVDPTFHEAADLPSVGLQSINVPKVIQCGKTGTIYYVPVEDETHEVCVPSQVAYPVWEEVMPAALRLEQVPAVGPPQVITDNSAAIQEILGAHQEQMCPLAEGGDGGGEGDGDGDGDGDTAGDGDPGDGDGDGSGSGSGSGGEGETGGDAGADGMNAEASCACSTREGAPLGLGIGILALALLRPGRRRDHEQG